MAHLPHGLVKGGHGDLDNYSHSGTQTNGSVSSMISEVGRSGKIESGVSPISSGRTSYVTVLSFKEQGKPSPTICPDEEEIWDKHSSKYVHGIFERELNSLDKL